ncbi:MAG: F0F1 ATP synthase subunit B family protein [Thermoanaerobaculia bacterium]
MQISLAPDLSLLAIMVIFWLNYVVVRKFFLRPINDVIEAREHETKTAETIFEQAMTHFQEATAKIEAQLTTARREASQLREQFRSEAAEFRNSVIEKTSNEARATVGEAEKRLEADVALARKKIASETESLARLAAERILGRSL